MKKWTFVIIPLVGMAIFIVLYMGATKQMDIRQKEQETKKAAADEALRLKQEEQTRISRLEQEKNQKAQAEALAKAQTEKDARWEADGLALREAISAAEAEINSHKKDIAARTAELQSLRNQREQGMRDYEAMLESIEAAKVQARNAEIEFERLNEVLIAMVSQLPIATPPSPGAMPAPGAGGGGRGGRGGGG